MDSIVEPGLKKRLIVLVPEGLAGSSDLAKKVYWLAIRDHCDVLYLAILEDEDTRLAVSRSMATMKALTTGDLVAVSSKIARTNDWMNTLHDLYLPGDTLVCHEEQFVRNGLLKAIPVNQLLPENFKAPIYTISGLYHPWHMLTRKWLFSLLFWVGCLAILTVFGLIEIQIDHMVQGTAGIVLLVVILVFEFATFWAWNHLPKV